MLCPFKANLRSEVLNGIADAAGQPRVGLCDGEQCALWVVGGTHGEEGSHCGMVSGAAVSDKLDRLLVIGEKKNGILENIEFELERQSRFTELLMLSVYDVDTRLDSIKWTQRDLLKCFDGIADSLKRITKQRTADETRRRCIYKDDCLEVLNDSAFCVECEAVMFPYGEDAEKERMAKSQSSVYGGADE